MRIEESKLDKVKEEIRQLEKEIAALKEENEILGAKRSELVQEKQDLIARCSELQRRRDALREECDRLRTEGDRMREDQDNLQKEHGQVQELHNKLRAERDQLRLKCGIETQPKLKPVSLKEARENNMSSGGGFSGLKEALRILKQPLCGFVDVDLDNALDIQAKLLAERDQLLKERDTLTAECARLEAECQPLRDKQNSLEAEEAGLIKTRRSLNEKIYEIKEKCDELTESIAKLRTKNKKMEAECDKLLAQLKEKSAPQQPSSVSEGRPENSDTELQQVARDESPKAPAADLAMLRSILGELARRESELATLQVTLRETVMKEAATATELADTKKRLINKDAELAELNTKLGALTSSENDLSKKVDDLTDQLNNSRLANEALVGVKAELDQKCESNKQLTEQIEHWRSNSAKLQDAIESLNEKLYESEKEIVAATTQANKESDRLKDILARYPKRKSNRKFIDSKGTLDDLLAQIQSLKVNLHLAVGEKTAMAKTLQETTEENSLLLIENKELKTTERTLRDRTSKLDRELTDFHRTVMTFKVPPVTNSPYGETFVLPTITRSATTLAPLPPVNRPWTMANRRAASTESLF